MKTTDRTERNMGLKGSIAKFRWIGIAIALIIIPVTGVALPGHLSDNLSDDTAGSIQAALSRLFSDTHNPTPPPPAHNLPFDSAEFQSVHASLTAFGEESDTVLPDTLVEFALEAHTSLFFEDRFPSANSCATCHPDHFREWSVSQHAYSQMSPVFNAFNGTVLKITNGTNGDFCIRCHTPVGMNIGEPEFMSNMDRFATSREGITCIVCHRLKNAYGKVSGRLAIVEGDIFDPVYGPEGGDELARVIESDSFRVNDQRGQSGRAIHAEAYAFDQISTSAVCGTCHDVNLVNGFRLEEAFSEYKASPASGNGISCQDCHMGREPGVASGTSTRGLANGQIIFSPVPTIRLSTLEYFHTMLKLPPWPQLRSG